jgi:hypothetical protein
MRQITHLFWKASGYIFSLGTWSLARRQYVSEDPETDHFDADFLQLFLSWNVRFEVFTAVTMKKAVFWDLAPYRYCVNRRFGGIVSCTCSRWFALGFLLFFYPEVGCDTFLRNVINTISTRRHNPEDCFLQMLKWFTSPKFLLHVFRTALLFKFTDIKPAGKVTPNFLHKLWSLYLTEISKFFSSVYCIS